jgi:hypothetical protein
MVEADVGVAARHILRLVERLESWMKHPHRDPCAQARALSRMRDTLRMRLLEHTGQRAPEMPDAELVQYAKKAASIEGQERVRKPFCALESCAYHHPLKRLCMLGLRRVSGKCPEYQPKKEGPVPLCHCQSCAFFYMDDWKRRCRLGRKATRGRCKDYAPRSNNGSTGQKIPACSKSSCIHWCRDDAGHHRCSIGLSRRAGQDCPEYRTKKSQFYLTMATVSICENKA